MREILRRLHYLFNRRRFDAELAEEMEAHRALASAQGAPFGNALRLREEARDAWGWTWLDRLLQDLRYAARILRKSPAFTLAAILLLAVGIGVNVAAFGFFNLMFFKPLPVRDPGTLVRLEPRSPQGFASYLPYPEMAFLRAYSKTLSAVVATTGARMHIDGEEQPISLHFVTGNFFNELGATPLLGRLLSSSADDASSAQPAAVLSNAFWQRHFASDPTVVGKILRLNGKPVTIVGVASEDFSGLDLSSSDVWLSLTQQPYVVAGSPLLTDFSLDDGVDTWGRLRPGITPKVAENELRGLVRQLHQQHPNEIWDRESIHAQDANQARLSHGRSRGSGNPPPPGHEVYPIVGMVTALVLLILAVACGNLGSLLLARSVAREREISIRVSLGAGRGRLLRQLLTESVLLAFLGSLAGLLFAVVALRAILLWSQAPAWLKATPDWRVIVFTLSIALLAAVLFGLTPSLQLARRRQRASFFRQVLVAGQVAASCILLVVSSLLVRALDRATNFNPGFQYQNVVAIEPGLESHGYTPQNARAYLDELQGRLQQMPGVESVALSTIPPLGGRVETTGTEVAGRQIEIHVSRVSPEFFKTMGIPIERGRTFKTGESRSIVIGRSFATVGWPGKDALAHTFTGDNVTFNVVGIAGTARLVERENADAVEAYFPIESGNLPSAVVLVKTHSAPQPLLPAINAIAKSIRLEVVPFTQLVQTSFGRQIDAIEKIALAVSALGGVALLIACLGIVGMVAYSVSQKTKEIGLRMALGATSSHVLFVILSQFGRAALVGAIAGLAAAAALSQLLRQQLYGVSNLDPQAYLAALGVFALVATFAALLPARRALIIDPVKALRHD